MTSLILKDWRRNIPTINPMNIRSGILSKLFVSLCVVLCVLAFSSSHSGEFSLFDEIKDRLNSSPQTKVSFLNLVVSDVFETTDTTQGEIVFTGDGLYSTIIGPDHYIFDGRCLWEYSALYAQATKNCTQPGQSVDESFLFFLRLDRDYLTHERVPDSVYALTVREGIESGAPDSMVVVISAELKRIVEFTYYDINEELNRILVLEEITFEIADSSLFEANFPDSTDILNIPD